MNYILIVTFSFTIFIAAIIGAVRFKKLEPTFRPFVYCIWLASLNELLSAVLTAFHINTAPQNNGYVLAEALLLGWQFKKWDLFGSRKQIFPAYIAVILFVWLINYPSMQSLRSISGGFRIIYSFLVVLMSIFLNNKLIYEYKENLLTSPLFIIGSGFIIYFTFKIFIEAFLKYGLSATPWFYKSLFVILTFTNLFTNLLFAFAILCIPKKIYYLERY